MKISALSKTEIVLQESPDGQLQTAYVRWTTDCSACGHVEMIVPAHHWKLLRDLLIDALDQHPELAGDGEPLKLESRMH